MDNKPIGNIHGLPIYEGAVWPECELVVEGESLRVPIGGFRYVDGVLTVTTESSSNECKIEIKKPRSMAT